MGSTLKNVVILVISLIIGIGITMLSVPLMGDAFPIDQPMQIVIAVILTLCAYVAFYFMAKGSGG